MGCTVFFREVGEGTRVRVETRVLGADAKRFHLYMQMFDDEDLVAVGEFMELHVQQKPEPHAAPMPDGIAARLRAARMDADQARNLTHRSRPIGLGQGGPSA